MIGEVRSAKLLGALRGAPCRRPGRAGGRHRAHRPAGGRPAGDRRAGCEPAAGAANRKRGARSWTPESSWGNVARRAIIRLLARIPELRRSERAPAVADRHLSAPASTATFINSCAICRTRMRRWIMSPIPTTAALMPGLADRGGSAAAYVFAVAPHRLGTDAAWWR